MSEPLPTIGYISHIVADALRDPTSGINTTQLRAEPNGGVSEALVFRSDALAKLAEKDAEIDKLQEAIKTARMAIEAGSLMRAAYVLDEALKGPEA
ncbi:hypothetical protein [Acetobacter senegalensis]|uniref:hypothetical protein n=1 Tax=Acetobacter senegalensis TaxID=446692 RepID=UPI001EDE916D|nr:hypothetical protein [Acetobacter senegalensis]MCG4273936.1 hypothetical protein [Acetobacter senegalensis]